MMYGSIHVFLSKFLSSLCTFVTVVFCAAVFYCMHR